jgi:hypothetical protein
VRSFWRGAVEFVKSADDNQDVIRPGCVLFANLVPVAPSMSRQATSTIAPLDCR